MLVCGRVRGGGEGGVGVGEEGAKGEEVAMYITSLLVQSGAEAYSPKAVHKPSGSRRGTLIYMA